MKNFDYQKLRENLPSGYIKTIARQMHCSESKVRKVASGERKDSKVLQALIDLAQKTVAEQRRLQKQLDNI